MAHEQGNNQKGAPGIPNGALDASQILARDFARMGIRVPGGRIHGTGPKPPRAFVHPSSGPTQGIPGMGDLHRQDTEPGSNYWTQWRQERAKPMEEPVQARMPRIPSHMADLYRALDQAFRSHESRKNDLCQCVTKPAWIEPPLTATCLDLFTDVAVTLGASASELINFTVPDRNIAVLNRMGMQVENPENFSQVRFSLRRNDTPLKCYGSIRLQLGEVVEPTKMSNPIVLKYGDEFKVLAEGLAGEDVFFRIQGWLIPVTEITAMGSYAEMPQK